MAGSSAQGASGAAAPGSAGTAEMPAPGGGMSAGGSSGNAGGSSGNAGGPSGNVSCPADVGTAAPMGDAGLPALPNLAATYQGTFSKPPQQVDTGETTDAPLLGNGDLGVAVLGSIDAMTFALSKNEFWSLQGALKAMARLSLSIPSMAGASYSMTEKIATGQVTGSFVQGGQTVSTTSWVQATDTTNNQLFTEIANAGASPLQVSATLSPGHKNSNPSKSGAMADVLYEDVQADSGDMVGGQPTRKVRVAVRAIGTAGTATNGTLTFTVPAGQKVVLATSVMSNLDSAMYTALGVTSLAALDAGKVDALSKTHQAWWDAFYRKSFVEIQDKNIEKMFYASLYLLACTSRTGEAPPGLWGSWILNDPAWFGDYTLNYNYETPFFAAFPTNHVELADSYDKPVTDWLPRAQALSTSHGWKGALYRVHIGPLPNGSADTNEWNQKSMGGWAATVMNMHYYYTLDPAYAASIYPTLKQMSVFWENYLVKNGDKYDIVNDAQHEGDPSPQTNGVMSLGLVRFLLQTTIDVSAALGMDADERAVWQDRLTHLSPYTTFTMSGKTVFRYTEVGRDWNNGNSIGIQHIYPGSQIGLSSDATLLQTAKNMVDVMARWQSGGGNVTFFPAAARVGADPTVILTQLGNWIKGNTFPNLHIHEGGGGIENFNTVPSTLSEMMLQSFQGTLRIFPTWPSGSDAKFASLRAYGAFLVSSAIQKDAIPYVRVVSERGGPFTIANPWPDKPMVVFRNGVDAGMQSGASVTLQTCANDSIFLAPPGSSYATISGAVNAP
ncbi:MAG TPA: hypothetical protein VNG33_15145 [Polyangiaceae bacterium]|nr:hypothetical protein [Polyangiaceae bacterium]